MDINKMLADMWKQICQIQEFIGPNGTLLAPAWYLEGNLGITEDNFLGTINEADLIFKTFSSERARITKGGLFGIGTSSPSTTLDINGQIRIRGGAPGVNKVLTSDVNGLATWQNIAVPAFPVTGADNGLNLLSGVVELGGTLLHNTLVQTTPSYSLSVTGDVLSTTQDGTFIVRNLSSTGNAVFAQANSGTALNGNSNGGVAVSGSDNSFGTGIKGSTFNGTAIYGVANSGLAGDFLVTPTSTNTVVNIANFQRLSSGVAGNNIGASIGFLVATTSGGATQSHQVISKWTDATFASRSSQFELWGVNNTTFQQQLTLKGTGQLQFNLYTGSGFTGTAAKTLAVDASGNVIMINNAVPGGSGTVDTANKGLTLSSPTTVQLGQDLGDMANPALISDVREIPITVGSGGIVFTAPSDANLKQIFNSNEHTIQGTSTISPAFQLTVVDLPQNFIVNWENASTSFKITTTSALKIESAGVGIGITPTAVLHLKAGTTAAGTAPFKMTSGALQTTAEVGAVEFLTDKAYVTITTGTARKEFTLNNNALTLARVPVATTNGRLTDTNDLRFNIAARSLLVSEITITAEALSPIGENVALTTYSRPGTVPNAQYGYGLQEYSFVTAQTGFRGYLGVQSWAYVTGGDGGTHAKFTNGYISAFSAGQIWDGSLGGAPKTIGQIIGLFSSLNSQAGVATNAYDVYASELNSIGATTNPPVVTNHYALYAEAFTKATNNFGIYIDGTQKSYFGGNVGIGQTNPTAKLHLAAGSATAGTSPIKYTSGPLLTTSEVGGKEFLTDKEYLTITTGTARKEITLNDVALTSGSLPIATTNGRLTNLATGANGTILTVSGGVVQFIQMFKGGQSPFTADGVTTVFNIPHNLGVIPSYFSLTTTEPIATNHLQRTITFPDANTMRITFSVAPSVGENANYVWIVYR